MNNAMRILMLGVLALAATAQTAEAQKPDTSSSVVSTSNAQTSPPSTGPVKGKETWGLRWDSSRSKNLVDGVLQLGGALDLKATGDALAQIESGVDNKGGLKSLSLVLRGVAMQDLPSSWGTCPGELQPALCIRFDLVRDPDNDEQRAAWNVLLGKLKGGKTDLEPRLVVANTLPLWIDGAPKFRVASKTKIYSTVSLCIGIFLIAWFLVQRSPTILRNAGTSCYSLGKSQMAFWGLLVVVSFIGVYFVTGTMEYIPPQVLILIGISAGTGLGAAAIGTGDNPAALASLAKAAETGLERLKAVATSDQPATSQAEAAQAQADIIQAKANLDLKQAALKKVICSQGFLLDICDDGKGMSFHRLQVVIWTFVLGAVFLLKVAHVLSMPEFPETLLALMGISNGTYIGYKLKELTS